MSLLLGASASEGRVEDSYDVTDVVLGRGAFSTVRLGRHRRTGEERALKIISAATYRASRRLEMGLRIEVAVMERIRDHVKSPHVVRMHEAFEDEMKAVIVLDLLRGRELFDRVVERGHYSEADAARITRELLTAVAELHDNGILHRDLKPENIIFVDESEDAPCRISDYGLGLVCEARSPFTHVDTNLVGTPGYVAPEVLERREYGPPCDVWSLGVILFILLCGSPPFWHSDQTKLFRQIRAGSFVMHPELWADVSEPARDLVRRMLCVDAARRITTAEALSHPWLSGGEGTLPRVHLTHTLRNLRRFNAKRKFRAVAMACVWGARLGLRRRMQEMVPEEARDRFLPEELRALRERFRAAASAPAGTSAARGDDGAAPVRTVSSEEGAAAGAAAAGAATTTDRDGEGARAAEPVLGELRFPQFEEVMRDMGLGHVGLQRLFHLFDRDCSGAVDWREFVVCCSTLRAQGEETLKFAFQTYDRDGNGYISREELGQVLMAFASDREDEEALTADALNELFDEMDANSDGRLSYEEFRAGCNAKPLLMRVFHQPVAEALGGAAGCAASKRPAATERAERRRRRRRGVGGRGVAVSGSGEDEAKLAAACGEHEGHGGALGVGSAEVFVGATEHGESTA